MNGELRRSQIQEYLSQHDILTVEEAVQLFQASPATIRRDFTELSANGGVSRVRGGICRQHNDLDELVPFTLRKKWYSTEKRYLAWRVYEYLKDVKTLFIDGGSTTTHLGIFLRNSQQTVITNSLPLCNVISEIFPSGGGPEIRSTGGCFHPESGLFLGSHAESAVAEYHADATILSARGVTASGIFNHNEQIAGINRKMMEHSDRVILIADHSKIGVTAMNRVCALDKIEALFTLETNENKALLNDIRSAGVKVFSDSPFEL